MDDEQNEQTKDDEIREAIGETEGGDPEGSDVQATITSPTGVPSYLNFLAHPEQAGAGNALGEQIQMDQPAAKAPAAPTSVNGKLEVGAKGATLSPLEARGYQGPDVRDPLRMGAAAMGAVDRDTAKEAEAYRQAADVTQKYQAENANILKAQQAEELHWAGADERAANVASQEAHKYIAAYQAQIAAVRQMTVDPTGPLGSMDKWQAGGVSLAMFAQGFLAARGIKIDVGGQIDRWVDRSIHEQERRIQQAQAGAEDQLHLWELARQTSRDDAEARQRYRGWVIAATQTALQANAAAYQSELAQADASEKIAHLQTEADKTKYQLWANTYQMVHADRVLQEQHRHDVVTESIQERHYQLQADAHAAKNKPVGATNVYLPDPEARVTTDPKTGRTITARVNDFMVNPNLPKEMYEKVANEVRAKSADETDYQNKLRDLITARQAVEDSDEWSITARGERKIDETSATWQHYIQAKNQFLNSEIYKKSGKAINESEFKRFSEEVPDQAVFQKGSTDKLLPFMQEVGRKEFQTWRDANHAANVLVPVPQNDPNRRVGVGGAAEPGLEAQGRLVQSEPAAIRTEIGNDLKMAESPEAESRMMDKPSHAWTTLMGGLPQPTNTSAVEDLMHAIVNPQRYRQASVYPGTVPENDDELNAQATNALHAISSDLHTQSGMFARQLLYFHKHNPEELNRLLKLDVEEARQ